MMKWHDINSFRNVQRNDCETIYSVRYKYIYIYTYVYAYIYILLALYSVISEESALFGAVTVKDFDL